MIITDKDTADDAKYHLMRENPQEPTKASECTDFFTLTDGTGSVSSMKDICTVSARTW